LEKRKASSSGTEEIRVEVNDKRRGDYAERTTTLRREKPAPILKVEQASHVWLIMGKQEGIYIYPEKA